MDSHQKNSSLRAVILDFGNVLTMPQDASRVERMRELSGLPEGAFLAGYRGLRHDYDRGTLDSEAYWKGILRVGGADEARLTQLDGEFVRSMTEQDIFSWTVIRAEMVEWIRNVQAAGIKTAILSNMPGDHAAYITRTFDWIRDFDVKVFSYAERLIKPEAAIYELCLRRLAVEPAEALFVDDIQANIDAARAVGIEGVLFQELADLVPILREHPEVPLPRQA